MFVLIPSWAYNYDEFWQALSRRNFWLIKLRYGAVIMLTGFIFSSVYILNFSYSYTQIKAISIINISILLYNLGLHYSKRHLVNRPDKLNPLHLSLVQMILDLNALWLLVYYTGGIESPLYLLVFFHMIIGSLILPGTIIYIIAAWFVAGFMGLMAAEYSGLVVHHAVNGFLNHTLYNDSAYVISFSVIFCFVVVISVLLANRIARQLYQMEQHLVEAMERLEKAEKEKQKSIISIVHEIKTPLAAVHSYLDVILQKYLGPVEKNVEEKLLRARKRSEEAMELVNDVLKISRARLITAFKKENIEIEKLLSDIINKLAPVTSEKLISILFEDRREKEVRLKGDLFWLDIAFSNIIGNSVKYTGEGGKIEIYISGNGTFLSVEITDNGIGIPIEDQENIFNQFYRASNTRNNNTEGSGLGLAISKEIFEKHEAVIFVNSPSRLCSSKGAGSTFIIKFNNLS